MKYMIGLMVELNGIPTYVENTCVINMFKNSSKLFGFKIMLAMKEDISNVDSTEEP